jgi:LAS superfamily LD-carboxypeptidase LdcB
MKKILLSSIILLGVCGAANAQTGKTKKNDMSAKSTTTSTAAPTPQKSAIVEPATNVDAAPVAVVAPDAAATKTAVAAPAAVRPASKTTVNAAGVAVAEDAKAADVKATQAKAVSAAKAQQ